MNRNIGSNRLPIVVAVVSAVAVLTAPWYPGSVSYYLLFQTACGLLATAAFLPPVSHGYAAFAAFLMLGFWVKVVLATIGMDPRLEPIGAFNASGEAWDQALAFSATGLVAVAVPKLLIALRRSETRQVHPPVPLWFARATRPVWVVTLLLVILGNAANCFGRFYMVGLHEVVVLPLRLNALISWWLTWGAAIWIALLLGWELRLGRSRLRTLVVAPIAEAAITSTIMLSRGAFLMKVLPYFLVFAHKRLRERFAVNMKFVAALGAISIVLFGLTLISVSGLRLRLYPTLTIPKPKPLVVQPGTPAPRSWTPEAYRRRFMTVQVRHMVLGRWIGLEGMLAVSAFPERSLSLWWRAMREDPNAGNSALYQRIARARYEPNEGVTFLTVPGVIGAMAYSGSHTVLAITLICISALLIATEALARRLFENEFLCAVVGVAGAYTLTQMNFPYLTGVFCVELWGTLLLLHVASRRPVDVFETAEVPAARQR